MSNILEEVQQYVADKLNADPQLSACHFIAENRRDVEFEIKQALGKQGVVGLVMTPKATFAGAYMDTSLAWQLDELEVDVVENVLVNRGKNGGGYITGQDAAMRLFDVLCPLSGEGEGKFCPVSYDEGEDGSLLVNKCILKCLVHVSEPEPEPFKPKGKVLYKTNLSQEDWLEEDAYLSGDNVLYGFEHKKQAAVAMLPDFAADGTPVKALGGHSLQDCKSLVSVDLPSALVSLGEYSMHDCESLRHLHLPDSVSCIADRAVSYCDSLSSVDMPSGLKSIGSSAFREDRSLLSVFIPPCELGEEIFVNCSSLSSAELGEGLSGTARRLFATCSCLAEVKLPSTLTSIGDETFARCYALSSIDMPSSLVSIGQSAFSTCTSLTGAVLPEQLSSIGHTAFGGCSSVVLSGIQFKGKTMAQVEAMPEYRWALRPGRISAELEPEPDPSLTLVTYAGGYTAQYSLAGTLNSEDLPNRSAIQYVRIGSSIDEIGQRAFQGMEFLMGVEIPDTVTAIGAWAFAGTEGMTDIEIPSSVSSIGSNALFGCHILSSAMFEGKTLEQVQAMDNYPWGIEDTSVISAELG